MPEGSITFSTALDNKQLEKDLAQQKKKIEKTETDIAQTQKKRTDAAKTSVLKAAELDAEKVKLREIKDRLKEIQGLSKDRSISLESREMYAEQIPEVKAELGDQQTRVRMLQAEYNKLDNSVMRYDERLSAANATLEGQKIRAGELEQELNSVSSGFAKIAGAMNRARSYTAQFVSFTKSGLKTLVLYAGRVAKSFLSLFKGGKQTNNSFTQGIKTMLKYSIWIRSLYVLFNKLRSAMADGFKNLAQYSESINSSISMVKSALTQLKNSFATAFAPILTVVAPIITQFINMLSSAADAIARLMAALTGKKSYVKAIAVQEDYAASLSGTAGAAEEAAGSLANFDEINTITTENAAASGGSGGGGGVSPSEMFETVEIEPLSFDSWGEAFSAFLDKILTDGIPALKSGLSAFATWLNGFSANLYEMFTFPGVYDKVIALGAELAYALNDFVNQIDWATLGGAIGAGLNIALGFLVSFIYNFDWINLGASLATMLNNAVAEIDWYSVGQLLWAKFKIAIELLAGFLLGLNMTQLAQAASDIAIGFFNSITGTLSCINWHLIGAQIAAFLSNIDWIEVVDVAFTALGEAVWAGVQTIVGFIENCAPEVLLGVAALIAAVALGIPALIASLPAVVIAGIVAAAAVIWAKWKEIAAYFAEKIKESGGDIVAGLLKGIVDALVNIGIWIKENIVDPFIDGFKRLFGIHSPSTVMAELGYYLMQGLLNGISSMVSAVVDTFSGLWEKIKGVFAHITDWFRDKFSDAWQAVKDVFSSGGQIFDGIKEGILSGLKAVINALISGINKVIAIPFNGINSALKAIKSVNILGIKPFSWINTISVPQIPRLAQGAVIPPNREFLAVLGDQKSGTNIEAPLSTIKQALVEALRETGGSGGNHPIQVNIMLDKRVLARAMVTEVNDMTRQAGKPVLLF